MIRRGTWFLLFSAGVAGVASVAPAAVTFGNFESGSFDGWSASNGGPALTAPSTVGTTTYGFGSGPSQGATLGSSSLSLSANGFQNYNLSYDFHANGLDAAFLANDIISFDVTYPAADATQNASGGFSQIYGFALNSTTGGFVQEAPQNPVTVTNVGYPAGVATAFDTIHVSFNYDAYKSTVVGPQTYIQFGIQNNNDANHLVRYFDNFQLSAAPVPEPTSLSLLGVAGAGMLRRRRRA